MITRNDKGMAQAFNNLSHPLHPIRKPQVVRSIRIAGSIFSVA